MWGCTASMRCDSSRTDVTAVHLALKDAGSGEVESHAAIALELAGGALGTVSVTTRAEYRSLFEVVGESGVIRCEDGLTVSPGRFGPAARRRSSRARPSPTLMLTSACSMDFPVDARRIRVPRSGGGRTEESASAGCCLCFWREGQKQLSRGSQTDASSRCHYSKLLTRSRRAHRPTKFAGGDAHLGTLPAFGDFSSFCIFMASITTMPWCASTSAPRSANTRTTRPGMGALMTGAVGAPACARRA